MSSRRPLAMAAPKAQRKSLAYVLSKLPQLHIAAGNTESSSVQFFTLGDFEVWKRHVLLYLSRRTSPIHDIVDRGNLPIFSRKNNKWFGVTASCRYCGQIVPGSENCDDGGLYERLQLRGLLQSDEPMEPSQQHTLQDHSYDVFYLSYKHDLVFDGSGQDHRESHLYLSNVYPKHSSLDWLTGGDLLSATAIIFALTRVRYLTVCEADYLRHFENSHRRASNPEYFYYNKFILSQPQHIERIFDRERAKRMRLSIAERDDYNCGLPTFIKRIEKRNPNTIMGCWLWENPLWKPCR